MKNKRHDYWPILLAFLMVFPFNVEFVIMNVLTNFYNIKGWQLFKIAAILGSIEMPIWLYIFSATGRLIKDNPRIKEFYNDIRTRGFDRWFRKFIKFIADRLDPDNEENNKIMDQLRPGYFSMFLMGISLGGWIIGIPIVKFLRWYGGFFVLMLGNIVKLAAFSFGYTFLGNLSFGFLLIIFFIKFRKLIKLSA